jgi:outer membrane protein assembly factor BamA
MPPPAAAGAARAVGRIAAQNSKKNYCWPRVSSSSDMAYGLHAWGGEESLGNQWREAAFVLWSSAAFGRLGGLAAVLVISACGVRSTAAELYPQVAEHQGRRVSDVRFTGGEPFTADTLIQLVDTQPSRCRFLGLPICIPLTRIGREEHRVNVARVATDVETLERFYRIAGYFNTQVQPAIEPRGENVEVRFDIARGAPIVLDALTITGTEEIMPPEEAVRLLPLQPGDIFHLGRFVSTSDAVLRALQRRGYAHAQVLRSFSVDTVDNRAEAALDVVTGPIVTVDSIIVRGAPSLGRGGVLRQVEIQPGELLRQTDLLESQRNLYQLEAVSIVSVTVAPDTLQIDADDLSRSTVLVSVVEAPLRAVEAAVGFGTQECLRTEGRWVHRSFLGGGRRLGVIGSVSRLGAGEPFDIGGGSSICPSVGEGTGIGAHAFDYALSVDFAQPYVFSPRNLLALRAYGHRQSEPGVYQRDAVGGQAGVSRRLGARSGGSVSLDVERGRTRASPALFCAAFLVCEPETVTLLARPRLQSELGATYFMDRSNATLDPTSGFVARTGVTWATRLLGSDVAFFRWTGEGSSYAELGDRFVVALSVRAGNFFRTAHLDRIDEFLPPEQRFFAGGATSVRGFERNALGPGVYVTDSVIVDEDGVLVADTARAARFVPTGGTSVAVANAELRLPSPVFSELMRLVIFVDAGAVGSRALWDVPGSDWRVTPGAGIRLRTPVGPVRMDLGFNPYDPPTAPLLFSDVETGRVIRVADEHQAERPGFFGRLRLHLGIGQAF